MCLCCFYVNALSVNCLGVQCKQKSSHRVIIFSRLIERGYLGNKKSNLPTSSKGSEQGSACNHHFSSSGTKCKETLVKIVKY